MANGPVLPSGTYQTHPTSLKKHHENPPDPHTSLDRYSPSPRPSFGEAFKRISTAIKRSSKDANVAEHETENPAKKSWRFSWKPKHFKVKSIKGLTKRWKSMVSKWSRASKTSENE
ncbi:hypothetical protein BC829DRAFT_420763 [Chytridium lagenaria]|nr:hypothetical protein BC829DRAFT_420763 [Chytridium lagenaria]